MATLAAYPVMMRRSRQRLGLLSCRAAWLIGVTVRDYRRLESGGDSVLRGEVFDRMCEVFGRPVSGRPG